MRESAVNYNAKLSKIVLCRTDSDTITNLLMPITDEEESIIDENGGFMFNSVHVPNKKIKAYGDIDVTKEDDIDFINKLNLVDDKVCKSYIPKNFNYSNGIGSNIQYPTINALEWFKFCHTRIGKPKKVIIFQIPTKLCPLI